MKNRMFGLLDFLATTFFFLTGWDQNVSGDIEIVLWVVLFILFIQYGYNTVSMSVWAFVIGLRMFQNTMVIQNEVAVSEIWSIVAFSYAYFLLVLAFGSKWVSYHVLDYLACSFMVVSLFCTGLSTAESEYWRIANVAQYTASVFALPVPLLHKHVFDKFWL
jgi:hypothetical protein